MRPNDTVFDEPSEPGVFLAKIEARHPSGEPRVLEVRVDPESAQPRQWSYYVRPIQPPDDSGEIYFAGVKEIRAGLVQLDSTQNNLPESYHHCCITCALIPVIAAHIGASVRSSKNPPQPVGKSFIPEADEMRSIAAEKVWKRMAHEHGARYESDEDRYYYDYPRGDPRRQDTAPAM